MVVGHWPYGTASFGRPCRLYISRLPHRRINQVSPDHQDQSPGGPQPRPLPARPRPAPARLAVPAVARRKQPGAAHRDWHLPDRHAPRPTVRSDRLSAPVPAPLQPHLAGPRRRRTRPDGTQRLDLPPDAHPLRSQRPRRPRPPQLRPHHGRHHLTPPRKTPPGSAPSSHGRNHARRWQPASEGAAGYPAPAQDRDHDHPGQL